MQSARSHQRTKHVIRGSSKAPLAVRVQRDQNRTQVLAIPSKSISRCCPEGVPTGFVEIPRGCEQGPTGCAGIPMGTDAGRPPTFASDVNVNFSACQGDPRRGWASVVNAFQAREARSFATARVATRRATPGCFVVGGPHRVPPDCHQDAVIFFQKKRF